MSTDSDICAGFDEGGKDTCQGDSPVFAKDQVGQLYQIGRRARAVRNRGVGCVHQRAALEWIRRHAPGFGGTVRKPPRGNASGAAAPERSRQACEIAQVTVDIP